MDESKHDFFMQIIKHVHMHDLNTKSVKKIIVSKKIFFTFHLKVRISDTEGNLLSASLLLTWHNGQDKARAKMSTSNQEAHPGPPPVWHGNQAPWSFSTAFRCTLAWS